MKLGQREGVGTRLGQRGRIALLCLSLSLVPGALRCASAAAAEWQPIGAAGDWANVVGALAVHGRLWTLDNGGTLANETLDGKRTQVGEGGAFRGSRIWVALGANLYVVIGGTMYGGEPPEHKPWRMVCDPEWWADTRMFINMNGYIWSIDNGGRLYRTNASCVSDRIGSDTIGARSLAATGGKLWAVDENGLNVLDPDKGEWELVDADDYGGTTLIGTADYLWTLDRDGTLSRAGAAGPWKQVGESREFHDVRFIFFIDDALYLVRGGTLYNRKI